MRRGSVLERWAAAVLRSAVRAYKACVSPWLGRNCRFEPTCSQYFLESIDKHGVWHGTLRGVARICRCHPWHPGGFDPP